MSLSRAKSLLKLQYKNGIVRYSLLIATNYLFYSKIPFPGDPNAKFSEFLEFFNFGKAGEVFTKLKTITDPIFKNFQSKGFAGETLKLLL